MIDINLIRETPQLVKENIKKKFQNEKLPLLDEAVKLDSQIRKLKTEAQELRTERNTLSARINEAKKANKDVKPILEKAKRIPDQIKTLEDEETKLNISLTNIMLKIPNFISKKTPFGKDASQNKVISKGGKINKFTFPIKTHVEIAEQLNMADFDSSARVSGKGFYYLKGLALLNQALIRFAIDFMTKKKYLYIETPLMLNSQSIFASMDKKAIEQSVYSVRDEDLNLIGTAEQSLLAMHANETILESELPKKYFSYSMCFRKEIGAHGINEKGLWRTHQFNKIEQFIFCRPEDSEKFYEELLKNSEEILKKLDLPYRVLEICTGDLADWKFRSADLEVYRPTTKEYGEVMSLSNCTDYQARKLNIKCLDSKGNKRVLHTLNDTALATSRILVAILENNQNKDGSVTIPKVLVPYVGKNKITRGV
ncbi:serine--tRNA ligase [Candidatus Woesearchaeota archaeon]|nr:serine--tRNA ligase [Candidatus Woesearchaeota archaeon]